jgi:DNA-binding FadR family transcriptional regulator
MNNIDSGSDLLQYIIDRNLQPGDALPSIQELSENEHLGVSTGKVREQLAVVRAMGLVEVRSRTGMRLKNFDFTPLVRLGLFFALARDANSFEEFSTLRTHIEVAFWHEACSTLTEDGKERMRECLNSARKKLHSHPIRIPMHEHRVFHITVFEQLKNPFVMGLLEAYWDAYEMVESNRYAAYDYLQNVWNFHERILDAICAGDFEAAKQAFIEHTQLRHYHQEDK